MKVLAAIPCLDEEVAIGSLVLRARRHVADVLVVDDGSTDRTGEVARLAGATVVRHPANLGKGRAYQTLWQHARDGGYDALVVLDGDGQHDADEIPLLLAKLAEGHDLVVGARWGERTQMPAWRRVGKRVLDYATAAGSKAAGGLAQVTDSQSGFRAYGRKALDAIRPQHSGFSVESQVLMDAQAAGLKVAETPIHCRYDVEGSTQAALPHAAGVLNEVLVQVGVLHPLLVLGLPGAIGMAFGLAAGAYAVYVYQSQHVFAPAWVLASMMLTILGALTLLVGITLNVLPRSLEKVLAETRVVDRR